MQEALYDNTPLPPVLIEMVVQWFRCFPEPSSYVLRSLSFRANRRPPFHYAPLEQQPVEYRVGIDRWPDWTTTGYKVTIDTRVGIDRWSDWTPDGIKLPRDVLVGVDQLSLWTPESEPMHLYE